ncbi:MAG: hypothetical protein K0S60_230 [Evtepia sp.]|jgi:hypothetical protein|nr:hypothetical protein [Evtepia sp.]
MNDVMTDNFRCPLTEYTIYHFLSTVSFVDRRRVAKLVHIYQKTQNIS